MTTAMSSPPSSWPRRAHRRGQAGGHHPRQQHHHHQLQQRRRNATRTGGTPNWAAVRGRAAKATRVTAGATPAKEAPSRPVAGRRGGIGTARTTPVASPAHATDQDRPHGPAEQPALHQRGHKSTDRLGPLEPDQATCNGVAATPSPMIE